MILALIAAVHAATPQELSRYSWLRAGAQIRSLEESFAPPPGFSRLPQAEGSFGAWLRTLPLRPENAPVRSYSGSLMHPASEIAAVAELDVGRRDLQQCADSIIRLHSEWMWSRGRAREIAWRFTSGDEATWERFSSGERAAVKGNRVRWARSASADSSRRAFREYLDLVFTYAGTISLERDSSPVRRDGVRPGDFLVQGGSPGHAVLVLDVAQGPQGQKAVLLGEGYTPAQDFHVLPGPWYAVEGDEIRTPFWTPFRWTALRRMKNGQ